MKALQIVEPRRTRVIDIPRPECGAGELLLKVRKIGMCGSDLSTYGGKNALVEYPRIPGHEIAATIAECGAGVPTELAPGTDVTVLPYTSCGICSACRRGRFNACRSNETLGVQRDGALTEYFVLPWQKVIEPAGLGLDDLVLVEPLTVGFHAVQRAEVTDSDIVGVFGAGMVGLGAVARAALRGATVVAIDVDDAKLEIAGAFGARFLINSRTQDLHERLAELTGGHGADVMVEAVGNPATYRAAVEEVAFAGRLACIGYAARDAELPTRLFVQKELDIRGSRNATPQDFASVVRVLARKALPVSRVVSRRVSIEDAGSALRDWAADPPRFTKIVVEVS